MAATRLNDSQKRELVARFCAGETAADLGAAYGVSANTALRAIKAQLEPEAYERVKREQQRGRRGAAPAAAEPAPPDPVPTAPAIEAAGPGEGDDAGQRSMPAIDDADDFADDDGDEDTVDVDGYDEDPDAFVAVMPLLHIDDHAACEPRPLRDADLPGSVYMLVDKTVELQAQPLRELPELGRLSEAELDRQALVVYANPRLAKQLCGRSQRVIKVPDTRMLERTAPYLLNKGISRVVLEGALYSLPGA